MPRKRKRFWNEGGIPGLSPELPRPAQRAPIPAVPVTPSTGLVFSPRYEKPQPEPAPPDKKKPDASE